jgi:DNA-binding winged helix-turn-helix (wHTH) protein
MADRDGAGTEYDFELGPIRIQPRERSIHSGERSVTLEPLAMQLLVALSKRAGTLISRREIFEICWGSAPVGDDSLNRVVALLRKALHQVGDGSATIETVSGAGYVLRLSSHPAAANGNEEVERAIEAGVDSWRLGLPEPDHLRVELLRRACRLSPDNARAWGTLAMLCRHAAEYCEAAETHAFVTECEIAARRATELEPNQPEALTALVGIGPLFGHWAESRARLTAIVDRNPDCAMAVQELATLEMSTGRLREGKRLRDILIARDPLGATYNYKSVYQHWAVRDIGGMDKVADRAIQLWPTHPAVWMVRFWTLAYTGRTAAAQAMIEDSVVLPSVPALALSFFRGVLAALELRHQPKIDEAVQASLALAQTGPANAIASMFALGLLDQRDEIFAVAEAYYLRTGPGPVPIRHTDAELSLNEQHRRLTQILFMPVFGDMRSDPRFLSICEQIGLRRYWEETGNRPDFLS